MLMEDGRNDSNRVEASADFLGIQKTTLRQIIQLRKIIQFVETLRLRTHDAWEMKLNAKGQ